MPELPNRTSDVQNDECDRTCSLNEPLCSEDWNDSTSTDSALGMNWKSKCGVKKLTPSPYNRVQSLPSENTPEKVTIDSAQLHHQQSLPSTTYLSQSSETYETQNHSNNLKQTIPMPVSRSNAVCPRVHFHSLGLPSSKLAVVGEQQKSHDFENNQRNVGAHVLFNAPICDNNASLYPDPILWQKFEPPNEGNHNYINTKLCDDVSLESTRAHDAKNDYKTFNHQDKKKDCSFLGSSNLTHNVKNLNFNSDISSQSNPGIEDEYISTHRNTIFSSKSCINDDNKINVPVYETMDINPDCNDVVFKRQESAGILSEAQASSNLEQNNMLEEHCSLRDKSKLDISGGCLLYTSDAADE